MKRWIAAVGSCTLAGALITVSPSAQATYPGRNGRIVYNNSKGKLATMRPDGSQVQVLTRMGNAEAPQVSADGQWIVFDDYVRNDLYKIRVDGSGLRRITNDGGADYEWSPSWSPDGRLIVFATDGGSSAIHVIKADGTHEHALGSVVGAWPRFSPNGAKIVYEGGDHEIHMVKADGTGDTALTSSVGDSRYPDWSPHGKLIAFLRSSAIWVMNADGSNAHAITPADADWGPSWSPDGNKLVYPNTGGDIVMVGANGSASTTVKSYTECCVAWGPLP